MKMIKIASVAFLLSVLTISITTSVYAGGDKNRGEVGVGEVNQHQNSELPYEPRP